MSREASSFIGVVLAGGGSRRMGKPKQHIPVNDGRTMLQCVVDALDAACETTVISGPSDIGHTCAHVPDAIANAGPLAGIAAVMEAFPNRNLLVCPCDMPCVTATMLQLLIGALGDGGACHFACAAAGRTPFPLALDGGCVDVVRTVLSHDDRSLGHLMRALGDRVAVVELDDSYAASLRNINTPEDVQQVLRGDQPQP